jgi:hypothetical protein
MTIIDWLTLVVAIWGAVLSTILAIREYFKERRQIKVLLEEIHWTERHKLTIINIGHRPITINKVGLAVDHGREPVIPIRSSALFATEEGYTPPDLPLTLMDGEIGQFHLSEYMSNELHREEYNCLRVYIYDAEGKVYTKYEMGESDPKYGTYEKKK